MIHCYKTDVPRVHPTAFVHESTHVIGDVELAADVSVWFGTVVRGDVHVNRGGQPTLLGEFVTVGHAARLHGCTIASHLKNDYRQQADA